MSTVLAILTIFGAGFLFGNHYGYKRVMDDVKHVIDRVEKQYTSKL